MNGKRSAPRSWIFFLVDRTGAMGQRLGLFEKELNTRIKALESSQAGTRAIVPAVIAIDAITAHRVPRQPSGSFRLQDTPSRCDLGKALHEVETTLQGRGFRDDQQVEILALLNSEPAGDWHHRAHQIKSAGAEITAITFGQSQVPQGLLKALVSDKRPTVGPVALNKDQIQRVLDYVFQILESVLPKLPEAAPLSKPPSAQPTRPATPLPISPSEPPAQSAKEPVTPAVPEAPPEPEYQRPEAHAPAGPPPAPPPSPRPVRIRIIGQGANDAAGDPAESKPVSSPDLEAEEPDDSQSISSVPDQGPAAPIQASIALDSEESSEVPESALVDNTLSSQPDSQLLEAADLDDREALDDADAPFVLSDRGHEEPSDKAYLPSSLPKGNEAEGGNPDEDLEKAAPTQISTPLQVPDDAPDEAVPDDKPSPLEPGEINIQPITVKPPPVDSEGVATNWLNLEPDPEQGDWVDHIDKDIQDGFGEWKMLGASRRGKMHAHKGIFREDAFKLGKAAGWHLMVVADGGGSCKLSRVGSHLAAETAVNTMARVVRDPSQADLPKKEVCEVALKKGLRKAWEALENEAFEREIDFKDLGTTFLALMHLPDDEGHLVGVVQVGDGLVAAKLDVPPTGKLVSLAEPDVGETASVTFFLTSKHWKQWFDRVAVHTLEAPPLLLAAMCDGVADDFIPFEQHLGMLFDRLDLVTRQADPEEALLEFLAYEKRGSFDDRTLTISYRPGPEPEQVEKPVVEEMEEPEQELDQEEGTEDTVTEEAKAHQDTATVLQPSAQPPAVARAAPDPDTRVDLQALASAADRAKHREAPPALFTPVAGSELESSAPPADAGPGKPGLT